MLIGYKGIFTFPFKIFTLQLYKKIFPIYGYLYTKSFRYSYKNYLKCLKQIVEKLESLQATLKIYLELVI